MEPVLTYLPSLVLGRACAVMRGSTSIEPQVTLQHEPSLDVVDQNAGLVANKLTTNPGPGGIPWFNAKRL